MECARWRPGPRSIGSSPHEGLAKAAIARRLSMSRNTVDRLLDLAEPPRYRRTPGGSQLGRSPTRSPRCSRRTRPCARRSSASTSGRSGRDRSESASLSWVSAWPCAAGPSYEPALGCSSEKLNLGPPASPAASHGGRTPWMRWNRVDAVGGDRASWPGPFVGLALLRPVGPFDDRCVMVRRAVASRTRRAGPGGGRRR